MSADKVVCSFESDGEATWEIIFEDSIVPLFDPEAEISTEGIELEPLLVLIFRAPSGLSTVCDVFLNTERVDV